MPGSIVVTGAAGFLGSHLVDALLARGQDVIGVDDLSAGRREHVDAHRDRPAFRFLERDLTAPAALDHLGAPVSAVVHLAGAKIPRYGDRLATLRTNARGAECALELARRTGARCVLASTSDVYGKSGALPFREDGDSVLGPPSVARWAYAVSKLFAEHLAFAYHEEAGVPTTVLRLFGVYGPRHHRSWRGGAPSVFIDAVLEGRPVEIHGDGRQTRTFLYVDDAVAALLAALATPAAAGQVLNVGSADEIAIAELAETVRRVAGVAAVELVAVPYRSFTGRPYEDVRRRVPELARAAALLGVAPRVGLEDGLARTIAWHRSSPRAAPAGGA